MKPPRSEDFPPKEGHLIIGKIQKAHSIRGEVFVLVFSKEAAWLDLLETLDVIQQKGSDFNESEYKVLEKRRHKEGIIIKAEGIADRNAAEELKGAMVRVPESFFVSSPDDGMYLREILGFTLFDGEVERGEIIAFSDNGMQDLAVVKSQGGQFEVPLVDEWMVEIDSENKKIRMDLPPGLFGEIDED